MFVTIFFGFPYFDTAKCSPSNVQYPIFAAVSKTCEHINIQIYRHLDMYGGTANDGGPGPETGSDGHAVCYEPV